MAPNERVGVWTANVGQWLDSLGAIDTSASPSDPATGDLWLVSWDSEPCGVVLVGQTYTSYSQVYPVVLAMGANHPGIVEVPGSTSPLEAWIAAGFGMGNFMFERRVPGGLSASTLRTALRQYHSEESAVDDSPELLEAAELVVDFAQRACSVTWPQRVPGEAIFSCTVLEQHLTVRDFARVLDIAPGTAASLWNGLALPSIEQVDTVAHRVSLSNDEILEPFEGPEEQELIRPRVKVSLTAVMSRTRSTESAARAAALRLALRSSRTASGLNPAMSAQARVDNALEELLRE